MAGALPILLLGGAALAALALSAGKANAGQSGGGGGASGATLGPDGFEQNMPVEYKQQAVFLLATGMDPNELDAVANTYAQFGFPVTASRFRQKSAAIRQAQQQQQTPPIFIPPQQQPPQQQPPQTIPVPGGGGIPIPGGGVIPIPGGGIPIPGGGVIPIPTIPVPGPGTVPTGTVPPPQPAPPQQPPPIASPPPGQQPPIILPGIPPGFPPIVPPTIPGTIPATVPPVVPGVAPDPAVFGLPKGGFLKLEDGAVVHKYVIQSGDYPAKIAESKYKLKPGASYVPSMVRDNKWVGGSDNWKKLQPGQELYVPDEWWSPPPGVALVPTKRPGPPDPKAGKAAAKPAAKPAAAKPAAKTTTASVRR